MKKLLFASAAAAVLLAALPASAQMYLGVDPGGVGVQVGPFGVGVGPRYERLFAMIGSVVFLRGPRLTCARADLLPGEPEAYWRRGA
jgi:hypothetical protein